MRTAEASDNECEKDWDFTLSDISGNDGSGNWNWRGYKFRVKEDATVTALRGGASSDAFELALFPLTGDDNNELQAPKVAVLAPSERAGKVPIDPVILSPNKYYFLAQGRSKSSVGTHYRASDYSVSELENSVGFVDEWEPENGHQSFRLTGSYSSEDAKEMAGAVLMDDGDKINDLPDLGLVAAGQPSCMCTAHEILDHEKGGCRVCPNGTIPNEDHDDCITCKAYEIATTLDSECTACPDGTTPDEDQGDCTAFSTTSPSPSQKPRHILITQLPLQRPSRRVVNKTG